MPRRMQSLWSTPQRAMGLAVLLGVLLLWMPLFLFGLVCTGSPASGFCEVVKLNPPWLLLLAIAAAPALLLVWFWRDQYRRSELQQAYESHLNDRFVRAIEHLGNDHIEVRLGGIYALERLAKDSRRDHPTIVETLAAFVRQNAPRLPQDDLANPTPALPAQATDIQAALMCLGRRGGRQLETDRPNLSETNLRQVQLADLDFSRTDFRKADLTQANLKKTLLTDAVLVGANLNEADLREANLRGVQLAKASLPGAKLRGADFKGANLAEAILSRANLTEANLAGASLMGANLAEAHLTKANLSGSNLMATNLKEANLREAKLARADLTDANLKGAHLAGANLMEANLTGANLGNADLRGANLNKAILKETMLDNANLEGANLVEVIYDEETVFPDGYKPEKGVMTPGARTVVDEPLNAEEPEGRSTVEMKVPGAKNPPEEKQ